MTMLVHLTPRESTTTSGGPLATATQWLPGSSSSWKDHLSTKRHIQCFNVQSLVLLQYVGEEVSAHAAVPCEWPAIHLGGCLAGPGVWSKTELNTAERGKGKAIPPGLDISLRVCHTSQPCSI